MRRADQLEGWFSQAAAESHRVWVYLGLDGQPVEVTCVCSVGWGESGYRWPDKVYRGLVGKFVSYRPGRIITKTVSVRM